jgi:hydrogenase maturation protease
LGNKVMADDSAGLVALERFQNEYVVDDAVDYMDGGTLGLDLLVYLEEYGTVLIADCLMSDGKPGDVCIVEAEDVNAVFQRCLSPHQMGIKDLLAVLQLQGRMPSRLKVVGVEGESIELSVDLTPDVEAAIGKVVETMASVLTEWGHEVKKV